MSSKSFFPTLIYYQSLLSRGLDKFNAELLDEAFKIRDYDRAGRKWSDKNYIGGYTSYASLPKLHRFSSTFQALEEKINTHVKKYIRELELQISQFEMTDCWLNIMPASVSHSLHLHPLSFISGTYYVSTPKDCGCIKFEDPRLSKFMKAPPKKQNSSEKSKPFVEFQAKAGKVVLFESWLRHEVPAGRNQKERVSISFNYDWS